MQKRGAGPSRRLFDLTVMRVCPRRVGLWRGVSPSPRQIFDKDSSGCIDAKELQQLMFEFGVVVPDEEVDKALAVVDTDGSGEIDLEEFSVWWLCAPHPQIKETVALKLLRTKLRLRQKLREVKESFANRSKQDMGDVYVAAPWPSPPPLPASLHNAGASPLRRAGCACAWEQEHASHERVTAHEKASPHGTKPCHCQWWLHATDTVRVGGRRK